MAYLWTKDELGWGAILLDGRPVVLSDAGVGARALQPGEQPTFPLLMPLRHAEGEPGGAGLVTWLLFEGDRDGPGRTQAHVNGLRAASGIVVLRDRDELAFGERRYYFTAETLPAIDVYDGVAVPCARCRQTIDRGAAVVRCPGCGALHHQEEREAGQSRPCWRGCKDTPFRTCALCPQSTVLASEGATLQFSPEDL